MKRKILLTILVTLMVSSFCVEQSILSSVNAQDKGLLTLETSLEIQLTAYDLWYNEFIKGTKVGYRHEKRAKTVLDGQDVVLSESNSRISINRLGSTMLMTTDMQFYETLDGQPVAFHVREQSGETQAKELHGKIKDQTLSLTSINYNKTTNTTENINASLVFSYGIDKMFKENLGTSFSFTTIVPNVGPELLTVDATYIDRETINIMGKSRELYKYQLRYSNLPNVSFHEWRGVDGVVYQADSSMLDARSVLVPETIAKTENTNQKLDIMASTFIYTKKMIPDPRAVIKAKYIVNTAQGDPRTLLVQDSRQKFELSPDGNTILTVNSYIPDFLTALIPIKEPGLAEYLSDNDYIQANDGRIAAKAREIIGFEKNAYKAAKALEAWVHENITDKGYDVGMASAAEVLSNRKGDCTEHAVLLAALCRSVGIPAKIVVGVMYVPVGGAEKGTFGYHMWNEVYVGEWIQLDAVTKPPKVVDSTHIALAKSSLNGSKQLSRLSETAINAIGNLELEIINYASRASGFYDIERLSVDNMMQFDLESLTQDTATAVAFVDLGKYQDSEAVEKYNVTGISLKSPLLETYEGAFTEGMRVFATGNVDKALVYFRKAAQQIPTNDAKKYYDLGVRLSGVMAFSMAKDMFEKAIMVQDPIWSSKAKFYLANNFPVENFTASAEKSNMLGYSFANFADNLNAANLMYTKALLESPNFESALFNMAQLKLLEGDYETSIEHLNRLLLIDPTNHFAYNSLARLYDLIGNTDKAIYNYQKALANAKGDESFIKDAKYDLAVLKNKKLLAANPKNAAAYINIAEAAYNNDNYKQAKNAYIKALSINYNNAQAHAGLGNTYLKLGKAIEAETEFNRALQQNSRNLDALVGLGVINRRRLEMANASTYFTKALSLYPLDKTVLAESGQFYMEQGSYQKAITLFQKMNNAYGAYKAGNAYLALDRKNEAKQHFDRAIALDPTDARAYQSLGILYYNTGNMELSRKNLEMAVSLDANLADAHFYLAMINEQQGNVQAAITDYINAYTIDLGNDQAYRRLYSIYEQMGILNKFNFPPPRYSPTKEEIDFMTRLLYFHTQGLMDMEDFSEKMLVSSKYGLAFNPRDPQDLRVVTKLTDQYLTNTKELYREAMVDLKPPQKYKPLKTAFLEMLWNQANYLFIFLNKSDINYFSDKEKDKAVVAEVEGYRQKAVEKGQAFGSFIDTIANKWNPIAVDEIFLNAGLDQELLGRVTEKLNSLNQKTQNTLEEYERKRQEKSSPQAMPGAPGNVLPPAAG